MAEPSVAKQAFTGNAPPITEIIDVDYADLFARVADWSKKAEAVKSDGIPTTADDERKMVEVVADGKRLATEIENARKLEGGVLHQAKRNLDGHFNGKASTAQNLGSDLQGLVGQAIQRREAAARAKAQKEAELAAEKRRKAEEAQAKARSPQQAERMAQAAETAAADERAAQARMTQKTGPARGGGGSVGVSKVWDFEIEDIGKIPMDVLRPFFDRDAIEKAIRSMVRVQKGNTQINGVRVFEKTSTTVRT